MVAMLVFTACGGNSNNENTGNSQDSSNVEISTDDVNTNDDTENQDDNAEEDKNDNEDLDENKSSDAETSDDSSKSESESETETESEQEVDFGEVVERTAIEKFKYTNSNQANDAQDDDAQDDDDQDDDDSSVVLGANRKKVYQRVKGAARTISAVPDDDSIIITPVPKTGDETPIPRLIFSILSSFGMILILSYAIRNRRD